MIVIMVFVCRGRAAYCCHQNQHQERKHGHDHGKEGVARVHVKGEPPGAGKPQCGDHAHQRQASTAPVTENIFKPQD
jgi:hypothetical protein